MARPVFSLSEYPLVCVLNHHYLPTSHGFMAFLDSLWHFPTMPMVSTMLFFVVLSFALSVKLINVLTSFVFVLEIAIVVIYHAIFNAHSKGHLYNIDQM